jgi:hypothetical protein
VRISKKSWNHQEITDHSVSDERTRGENLELKSRRHVRLALKRKFMRVKSIAALGLVVLLAGCDVVVMDRPYRRPVVYQPAPVLVQPAPAPVYAPPPGPVVAAPPAVVAQPAPAYVEEGSVVGGVVVTEPVGVDYVLVGGGWYYWHPGLHVWVHATRGAGWRPRGRVYTSWGAHPMYRR